MEQELSATPDLTGLESALALLIDGATAQGYEHADIQNVLLQTLVYHAVDGSLGIAYLPPIWNILSEVRDEYIAKQKSVAERVKQYHPPV